MPAYDFRCTTCGSVFEVVRPAGTVTPEQCPDCDGATKRVFTPVGVVFKGSGFHSTDYRKPPKEGESEAPPSCPAKNGSDTEPNGTSPACASCPAAKE